jgi:hypothetical protein
MEFILDSNYYIPKVQFTIKDANNMAFEYNSTSNIECSNRFGVVFFALQNRLFCCSIDYFDDLITTGGISDIDLRSYCKELSSDILAISLSYSELYVAIHSSTSIELYSAKDLKNHVCYSAYLLSSISLIYNYCLIRYLPVHRCSLYQWIMYLHIHIVYGVNLVQTN